MEERSGAEQNQQSPAGRESAPLGRKEQEEAEGREERGRTGDRSSGKIEEEEEEEEEEEIDEEGGEHEDEEDDEGDMEEEEDFIPLSDRCSIRPPWYRASSVEAGYPLRTLHNEILDLCDLLMPTPDQKAKTATTITYVRRMVYATLGGKARVEVFGSQLTGLILPSSDIDMVVLGGPHNSMASLGKAMWARKARGEVRDVTVISKAKVPLVKFVHAATGIQVDVCFDQPTGLQSGQEAKALMRQMPPVRPLVMVLKVYMAQRDLKRDL